MRLLKDNENRILTDYYPYLVVYFCPTCKRDFVGLAASYHKTIHSNIREKTESDINE